MCRHFLRAMRACVAFFGLAIGWACAGAQSSSDLPPMEVYFGKAAVWSVQLSPSGRWVAASKRNERGRMRLEVYDLTNVEPGRVLAEFDKLDVAMVQWVNDDWIVFDIADEESKDPDTDGGSGLWSVKRDGSKRRHLIKRDLETLYGERVGALEANHGMLRVGDRDRNEIVVGEYTGFTSGRRGYVLPMALNVETGQRRSLATEADFKASSWLFDAKGVPRVAEVLADGTTRIYWSEAGSGKWREVYSYKWLAREAIDPVMIDKEGRLLVTHLDDAGFTSLSAFDAGTGKVGATLLATPGFSESVSPIYAPDGSLVGANVLTDAYGQVWFDSERKALQAKIDGALPGRVNLTRCGQGCSTVLIQSFSDRTPDEYLVYTKSDGKLARLFSVRPEIDARRMAPMDFQRIKARDGLEIPVWFTIPASAAKAPAPAVVLVHGGPWARGTQWRWNDEAQFLASRGYVVIEPEFRGSIGFGDAHYRAGWKQWGQAMQDDVSDSLQFAVKRGWVDPKRVCIFGGSYGGYATLMGLAKDSDQYRCGIAVAAVTDPALMFSVHWSDISSESKRHSLPQLIGDPVKDAAMLKANSPVEQVSKIKAPVMLMHGKQDRRVPIVHAETMRQALKDAGREPEWAIYDYEQHGILRPDNLKDYWNRIDTFLAKHLK
jgi:dipeptidyl aminopeptidase/acylaminoacyl peptidase